MSQQTREEYAQFNRECRIDIYKRLTLWAAIGAVGPMGFFLSHNVLHTPQPVARTFTGYHEDMYPMGDSYETYNYEYASAGDHALDILGFVLGLFAAVAVALLFYCLARFVADPIMYRIDLRTEKESGLQLWSKRIVMTIIVLLYCSSMVFAYSYDAYPDREDYDVYTKETHAPPDIQEEDAEDPEGGQDETEPSKTPVERGYPSNDLQYYIDHPDEPMPQELAEELMAPDDYSPEMDYTP